MMEHTFTVYLKVRGQGRPRVDYTRRRTYKDKTDVNYERQIREAYINSGGGWFGNKPIEILVDSYRALPKSAPKKLTREHDTKKPDNSNRLKAVEDALNGVAYVDDAQIVHDDVWKFPRVHRDTEKLVVTIRTIDYSSYPKRGRHEG